MAEGYTHAKELNANAQIAKVRALVSSDEEIELLKNKSKRVLGERLIHLSILLRQAGETYVMIANEERNKR